MAAVLDAMVPHVKKLLTDMAEEEVSMLLGVSSEITRLEDNMEGIKAFVADAERRRLTDDSVRRWVRKLKDAMYDAIDIIDVCHLEADKRRGSTKDGSSVKKVSAGCFQPLLFCMRNPMFAHKIGSRIKELNQRLDGIHMEADRFKFSINLGSNMKPRKLTDAERSMQKTTSEFNESAIVGEKIEQDTRELAQLLITGGLHDIKVVSIVGTGGMGKTTLAKKIFNEVSIQENFEVKVWLSITQHFNETELLKTAIEQAGGVHGGTQDKTLLTRTLTKTLSTGRFLLVMDDVWSDPAWTHVLSVPIINASKKQQGNCVLITTRLEDLGKRMGASYQHRVSPLNEEDAWSLLTKQLPPSPNQVIGTDYLRDVGMKILRKCDGLPLAVKVMGGLLSRRSRSEREWEAVFNHPAWSIAGLPKELDSRIYLSYEDLSSQQKQCFLYCSLFPKGTCIRWRNVIPMWISEGFIQPHTDKSSSHDDQLEEIATEYYEELITRNLIEPKGVNPSTTAYHCTMHDVVRSFAKFMAREESLVVQEMQVASSSNDSLVRRLSIGPSSVRGLAAMQKRELVRTLFINSKIDLEQIDSLDSFSMLRVLYIHGGDCDRLVGSLCQLRHLRYFGLEETNISRLPDDIDNMKFLQHIVLRGSVHLKNLPRTIIQLVHLRSLDMYGSNANVVIPKEFGGLRNIRALYGFRVHMDMDGRWCSLEEIGPLSKLRKLILQGLESVSASSLAEMARISSKKHLEYMELHWSSSGCMESRNEIEQQQQQQVVEEVLEKLCPPPRIHHLEIRGYFGRTLPNWMMVVEACAFKSLSLLRLQDLLCCTKLPDGLCRLPNLKVLAIVDVPAIKSVGSEFQASFSSSTVAGGITASTSVAFPNLTHLSLEGLCKWEEWDWEEQTVDVTAGTMAMHALEYLLIEKCKLSCLPPGLANNKRHALRELELHKLSNLASVENFPSVVKLDMFDCPKLKRITGLSMLHRIRIFHCPKLEVLQGVPSLDSIELKDGTIERLPGYLQCVNPRFLKLTCSKELHHSIISGSSSECEKISHITKHDINYIEGSDED
ncbi:hypothetical protein SEVIR_8G092800v4 [Setaria viridis]|uniref:AAA+ ATPase domain-containing protein n=1 Tax=Setaria viridis TaxID=4556 RepID=A0A4U6TI07_SETVI|nr:disease resistance protein RGA2-like [Setaria viridis]TKW00209.1 hypothetical protein SEVIR_8G092800v2 [Setaria viridis]